MTLTVLDAALVFMLQSLFNGDFDHAPGEDSRNFRALADLEDEVMHTMVGAFHDFLARLVAGGVLACRYDDRHRPSYAWADIDKLEALLARSSARSFADARC